MASTSSNRPQTSRPRGVCIYFSAPSGCHNGNMCKFLHGSEDALSPFDKNKVCRFFAAGFCKRGVNCWFRHVSLTTHDQRNTTPDALSPAVPSHSEPHSSETAPEPPNAIDDGHICCICQEKPVTYGLLMGCSHICCLQCIRAWRDPHGKGQELVESGNTKRCPCCRAPSLFVTPSSVFYPVGDPLREATIQKYKESMARVPCKHFEKSTTHRHCPFGRDCFYQHKNPDGSYHTFLHGADHHHPQRSRQPHTNMLVDPNQRMVPSEMIQTMAVVAQRLMDFSNARMENAERATMELIEDVMSSLGMSMLEESTSFSTALQLIGTVLGSEAPHAADGSDEEDDEDLDLDVPPSLVPFSHVRTLSSQNSVPSPLPLTRSFMTTSSDQSPEHILATDLDESSGVAVTTNIHVRYDDAGEPRIVSDDEGEGEPRHSLGGGHLSNLRTSSGTDLSSFLRARTVDAELVPDQPPRPRSAISIYPDDSCFSKDNAYVPAVDSESDTEQQPQMLLQSSTSTAVHSPSTCSSALPTIGVGREERLIASSSEHHPPLLPESSLSLTPLLATSSAANTVDANTASLTTASSRKEIRREKKQTDWDLRRFVTDGRGRVIATAEADPDGSPSLYWTQPFTIPGQVTNGDEETGDADNATLQSALSCNDDE